MVAFPIEINQDVITVTVEPHSTEYATGLVLTFDSYYGPESRIEFNGEADMLREIATAINAVADHYDAKR